MRMLKWLVGFFLLICGVEDVREKQIYVYPAIVASLLVLGCQMAEGGSPAADYLGGLAVGAVLLVVSLASRGQMGMGDALLFCLTGLTVGFGGNIQIVCYSFLLAGIVSGYMMWVRRRSKKYKIPFVPYLFAGYCLVAAYGL